MNAEQSRALKEFDKLANVMMHLIKDNFGDNVTALITSEYAQLEQTQRYSTLYIKEMDF